MAKTIKRVLNEVLVRYDLLGNVQGVHARYATFLTLEDGLTPSGTPVLEDASPADWNDPELMKYFTDGILGLQDAIREHEAQLARMQEENNALSATCRQLELERDELKASLRDTNSRLDAANSESRT